MAIIDDRALVVGDEVKMRGGCPHAWVVYALWSADSVHIQRWSDMTQDFIKQTFVDPKLLVKV